MTYEQIKELSESKVLAIYLSGSHLNNTYTDDSFKDSSRGTDSVNIAAKIYLNDYMDEFVHNNVVMDSFKNKQDIELKKNLYSTVKDTLEFC